MNEVVYRILAPVAAGLAVAILLAGLFGGGPGTTIAFLIVVAIGCVLLARRSDRETEASYRDLSVVGWLAAFALWGLSEPDSNVEGIARVGWWAFTVMLIVLFARWAWRTPWQLPADLDASRVRRLFVIAWIVAYGLWWALYPSQPYSGAALGLFCGVTAGWIVFLLMEVRRRTPPSHG